MIETVGSELTPPGAPWWRRWAASHQPHKVLHERGNPANVYLVRWRIWGLGDRLHVYVHLVLRPDDAPDAHDHPWPFAHMILEGGYVEWAWDRRRRTFVSRVRRPWACAIHRADYAHRIAHLLTGESWSLVVVGPRTREWGFIDQLKGCWVHWMAYMAGEDC